MTYDTLATEISINKAVGALAAKNFHPLVVASGAEALAEIKKLIPSGKSVMNGASVTLEEIGFFDYLKTGTHGWKNMHALITAEPDAVKRMELRKQGITSDFYLGSAHALTEAGDLVFASNTGSQLPHLAFTSPNIILVVSTQKIVPDLDEAMKRIREHIIPLEDERMMHAYKAHTAQNKTLILHGESPIMGRTIHVIIVKEKLGF